MKFFVMMSMMLGNFLIPFTSLAFEGLYFKSVEGEEIKVIPTYENQRIVNLSFETDCYSNNGYCMSNRHANDILEGFINSSRNKRLYTYRYVTADPCMDPRNGCTPHGGDDIQTVDINNEPERVSPMRTTQVRTQSNPPQSQTGPVDSYSNALATQLGTDSAIAIVDYLKKFNGKNDNPNIVINSYKLSNGKRVPHTMCRPVERFCDNVDFDVTINTNSGVTVNYEARITSREEVKRFNAVWDSLFGFFEGEYTCVLSSTGTASSGIMKGQLVCYWSPY